MGPLSLSKISETVTVGEGTNGCLTNGCQLSNQRHCDAVLTPRKVHFERVSSVSSAFAPLQRAGMFFFLSFYFERVTSGFLPMERARMLVCMEGCMHACCICIYVYMYTCTCIYVYMYLGLYVYL